MKKVKVIEGPITISGLNPTEKLKRLLPRAPQIILLGDSHVGDLKCKDYVNIDCDATEGCYTLYKSRKTNSFVQLLDNLAERNRIGLFLETWIGGDYYEASSDEKSLKSRHNSALGYTLGQLVTCYFKKNKNKSNCAVKNLEVHFSDPRQLYDEEDKDDVKYKADIIIDFLDRAIKSKNTLEYLKTLHKHLFPSVSFKEMMLTIKTILTEPLGYNKAFWNSELFDKYSRTKRQIKKLPLPVQNILQDYIIEKYTSLQYIQKVAINTDKVWGSTFDKSFTKILESLIEEKNPSNDDLARARSLDYDYKTLFTRYHMNPDILDLYFIARILRQNFQFNLVVGFFGSAHTRRMIDFLTKQGLYEQIFYYGGNNKYIVDEEANKLKVTSPLDYYELILDKLKKVDYDKCIPLT